MDHQTKIVKISVLLREYYLLHQLFVYFDEKSAVVKVSDRSTIFVKLFLNDHLEVEINYIKVGALVFCSF